jgi:hypothetical protein
MATRNLRKKTTSTLRLRIYPMKKMITMTDVADRSLKIAAQFLTIEMMKMTKTKSDRPKASPRALAGDLMTS